MKTISVGTIVHFVFLAAASAVAQTSTPEPGTQAPGSERVYKGLFGTTTDPLATHALGVTATLAAAYDDDVYGDTRGGGVQPGLANPAGYYGLLMANADYDWRGRHTQVGATASSAFHYYSDRGKLQTVSYTAGVGFSTEFARRTTLLGNQAFAYSPSYLYGLFPGVVPPTPGDVPPAAPDYSAYDTESYAYTSRISVTHGLTRRGQLTGAIEWQYTDFTHEIDLRRDLMSYKTTLEFSQNVSRNTALTFGYRFRTGDFGYVVNQSATEHGLDIGVDYTRPLSATRRLVFGFAVGSAAVENSLTIDELGVFDRQYHVLGDMRFGYQFGQTWEARATYRRGLEYVPGLRTPVYASGFTTAVTGLINRRWDVLLSAAYSDGASALVRDASSTFDTYTANLRTKYAFSRTWAVYADYLYYYYDFRGTGQLPPGVAPVLERNGVRVGVMLWAPMTRK